MAASWMGWETVAQVEWDGWCQKVLAKNFPDALRFGDIKEFNNKLENGEIITDTFNTGHERRVNIEEGQQSCRGRESRSQPSTLHICESTNIGRIDIITGGFPCQPFSHAGKRKGVADERYLWPEMLRTIRILKPSFVVGENVAGLVSMDDGKTLDAILADLENEGYQVESFIIPACAVGAWHRRDRIWIVAHSVNCSDRTNGRKSGKAKTVSCECGTAGLPGEFGRTDTKVYVPDTNGGRRKEQRVNKSISENVKREAESIKPEYAGSCNGREFKARTRQFKSRLGGVVDGVSYWLDEPNGVPRVATGIKDRVNRLKGLGNAIVPQVVFEIFKAIECVNY